MWLETCGEKPLTLFVIRLIGCILDPVPRRLHMSYGREGNQDVKYFRIFGSTCFILKDRENMGKFDFQSDEGIFLGYSSTSKAYRVYNKRTMKVMETVNIVIDESSKFGSDKFSEEIPKEILPPEPKEVQEIVE